MLLGIYFYSCDFDFTGSLSNDSYIDPLYPTKIYQLTENQRSNLQTNFDLLNNDKLCSSFDKFGFLKIDSECDVQITTMTIIRDHGIITKMAKQAVIDNSKFTNVVDSLSLVVKDYHKITAGGGHVRVSFEEQIYDDIPIHNTNIDVYYKADTIYAISDGWFKDIYIPKKVHSFSDVKNKLIGKEFRDYTFGFKISEDTFNRCTFHKEIYPLLFEDRIEIRIVYNLIFTDKMGYNEWQIIVDILNYEILFSRFLLYH